MLQHVTEHGLGVYSLDQRILAVGITSKPPTMPGQCLLVLGERTLPTTRYAQQVIGVELHEWPIVVM
jgi:hypothetical protein